VALARAAVLVLFGVAAARAGDPAAAGPFKVGVTTLTLVDASRGGRTLVTEVWYPARHDGRDAPARRGRHPLVLLAHGHCGSRLNYQVLTTQLASRGFVVAAPDFPQFCLDTGIPDLKDPPVDLSFLRTTLRDRHGPAASLARVVGGRHTGIIGHSLGGFVVARAPLADPLLDAVVALAPAAQGPDGTALAAVAAPPPLMVMGGTADTTAPLAGFAMAFFEAFVAGNARPAFLATIIGGTHDCYTDHDSSLSPTALVAQRTIVLRYVTAFLERYVEGRRHDARVLRTTDDPTVTVVADPR
jgi:dienelactone hydrolase